MMNQKQRDHFIDRVKEKCKDKINTLKAKHAAEIQNLADTKYHEFIRALGLEEDMHALKTAEQVQDETGMRVKGILEGLKDIHPKQSYYGLHTRSSDLYESCSTFLQECCRATAEKEFYNTEAGQELKSLEDTQTQAIDTIMMDGSKVADLTLKLNGILGNSGMQLLGEGVQA